MRVLLVSTYELGRQPLHVASPAAALRRAGHDVRAIDLAVEAWDPERFAWADAIGFSVYMHTSTRLAVAAARRLRSQRPVVPVCFYGLYAPVGRDELVGGLVDRALAGEYEPGLVAWADVLSRPDRRDSGEAFSVHLGRSPFALPARDLLPSLDQYARLEAGGERLLVGAVESAHGCSEQCRHCPVPAVYGGRTRIVDVDLLLEDVEQLVALGARHVTFGDPDFLSGPAHARRVIDGFADRFPSLTFDVTTKVEHVLRHPGIWPTMADAGCLFVVSAVECLDDGVLRLLRKGHTAAMAAEAVTLLRAHGIEPKPSFLPFTPWTTPQMVLDILDFVAAHDLVPDVDPVQYSLRLLLPDGSLLLEVPELAPFLDGYDPEGLTHRWRAADPAVDELQARLSRMVEQATGASAVETYAAVREMVARAAGRLDAADLPRGVAEAAARRRPRLTEPWFCCAEPTAVQFGALTGP